VIVRDGMVLLCRLAPWLSESPLWTLPGGGVEFGEDPRDAVVREVHEETGLDAMIGDSAHVHSVRFHASNSGTDLHSVRIVYDGWVPRDAPEPHVVERDGSTVDVAWFPLADVESGAVRVSGLVSDALAAHAPAARQRLAAYALVRRGDEVLLTRMSPRTRIEGRWTLPGGGIDHGEDPRDALRREVHEECGIDIGTVTYLGSQPWPFPSSLMLGFSAQALTTEVHRHDGEIAEARWYTRDALLADIGAGRLHVSPSISISRRLIEHWYGEPLPHNAEGW